MLHKKKIMIIKKVLAFLKAGDAFHGREKMMTDIRIFQQRNFRQFNAR